MSLNIFSVIKYKTVFFALGNSKAPSNHLAEQAGGLGGPEDRNAIDFGYVETRSQNVAIYKPANVLMLELA